MAEARVLQWLFDARPLVGARDYEDVSRAAAGLLLAVEGVLPQGKRCARFTWDDLEIDGRDMGTWRVTVEKLDG